jgi:hypothetical protein
VSDWIVNCCGAAVLPAAASVALLASDFEAMAANSSSTGCEIQNRLMKIIIALMLVGLGFSTLLVGHYGFAEVGNALLVVGWSGLIFILFLRLGIVALCGIAWGALRLSAERPVVMGAFIAVQQRAFAFLELVASRLARQWVRGAAKSTAAVQTAIHSLYGRHRRLLIGSLLHLIAGSAVRSSLGWRSS